VCQQAEVCEAGADELSTADTASTCANMAHPLGDDARVEGSELKVLAPTSGEPAEEGVPPADTSTPPMLMAGDTGNPGVLLSIPIGRADQSEGGELG
jgi:hypothetical protein